MSRTKNFSLLLLGLFLLPVLSHAAVIKQTGTPESAASMNAYMQGQTTVSPTDGLSHTFGSMTVYAVEAADGGSPIYFRIKNLTSGSFVDCRTDYLDRADIPAEPSPATGGPAVQGVGEILNLDFSGTGCTSVAANTYFVYIVSDAQPTSTGLADIHIGGNTSNGEGSIIVRDTPYVPAPTTEYNEVVDYVYDPNLDNSFGTSTVGAIFSIAQPDWVSSIGYDLLDPTGLVVDTDFVNDPIAGTYTIAKEYDFDATGVYTLKAWFIQETGSGYQRIDNPVTLSIIINVPSWVFDPVTGDLVPAASTTISTSTLNAFKIECDTGNLLLDGACKLIVGFFIPSPASIQGVQASFATLMTKAPFSFFTQSRTVLDAFRTGTAASGGSFSLTLYGSSVPIVSSTTASSVGLDSTTINFLKSIMRVALYLMLAWYLYWRIASIFGV